MAEQKDKCPECLGTRTVRVENHDCDPPDAWIEDCPTCNGTGDGDYFPTEEEQTEHDENYEFMRRG